MRFFIIIIIFLLLYNIYNFSLSFPWCIIRLRSHVLKMFVFVFLVYFCCVQWIILSESLRSSSFFFIYSKHTTEPCSRILSCALTGAIVLKTVCFFLREFQSNYATSIMLFPCVFFIFCFYPTTVTSKTACIAECVASHYVQT